MLSTPGFNISEVDHLFGNVCNTPRPRHYRVFRRPKDVNPVPFLHFLLRVLDPHAHAEKLRRILPVAAINIIGRRNLKKTLVRLEDLSEDDQHAYRRIERVLNEQPLRLKRVRDFMDDASVTRRLINYFVVHYSYAEREVSYYLDKTVYPYRIVGEIGEKEPPEAIRRIQNGEHIVHINLHREYKSCKPRDGHRNRHAPYRRSNEVQGPNGIIIELCEMNFYTWLDEVGGIEAFWKLEEDVRQKKVAYDRHHRKAGKATVSGRKRPRHHGDADAADGQHPESTKISTVVTQCSRTTPYCGIGTRRSWSSIFATRHGHRAQLKQ